MIVEYVIHGEIMLEYCSRLNDEDKYLQAILLIHLSLNHPSIFSIRGGNIGVKHPKIFQPLKSDEHWTLLCAERSESDTIRCMQIRAGMVYVYLLRTPSLCTFQAAHK